MKYLLLFYFVVFSMEIALKKEEKLISWIFILALTKVGFLLPLLLLVAKFTVEIKTILFYFN